MNALIYLRLPSLPMESIVSNVGLKFHPMYPPDGVLGRRRARQANVKINIGTLWQSCDGLPFLTIYPRL